MFSWEQSTGAMVVGAVGAAVVGGDVGAAVVGDGVDGADVGGGFEVSSPRFQDELDSNPIYNFKTPKNECI